MYCLIDTDVTEVTGRNEGRFDFSGICDSMIY